MAVSRRLRCPSRRSISNPPPRTERRRLTVTMHKSGLRKPEAFTYFCGCAWREITDLQESARRILESEES